MNRKNFLIMLLFFMTATCLQAAITYTFKEGDTLWDLAGKYYGDHSLHKKLAEYNNISNPRTIPNGRVITIPDKAELSNPPSKEQQQTNVDGARKNSLTDAQMEFKAILNASYESYSTVRPTTHNGLDEVLPAENPRRNTNQRPRTSY